jgi:hypothetical protein
MLLAERPVRLVPTGLLLDVQFADAQPPNPELTHLE